MVDEGFQGSVDLEVNFCAGDCHIKEVEFVGWGVVCCGESWVVVEFRVFGKVLFAFVEDELGVVVREFDTAPFETFGLVGGGVACVAGWGFRVAAPVDDGGDHGRDFVPVVFDEFDGSGEFLVRVSVVGGGVLNGLEVREGPDVRIGDHVLFVGVEVVDV